MAEDAELDRLRNEKSKEIAEMAWRHEQQCKLMEGQLRQLSREADERVQAAETRAAGLSVQGDLAKRVAMGAKEAYMAQRELIMRGLAGDLDGVGKIQDFLGKFVDTLDAQLGILEMGDMVLPATGVQGMGAVPLPTGTPISPMGAGRWLVRASARVRRIPRTAGDAKGRLARDAGSRLGCRHVLRCWVKLGEL